MRALDLAVVLLAAAALLGPPAAADDQPSDPEAGGTAEDGTPGTEELGTEAGTAGGSGAGTGEEPPGREGLFDTLHGVVDSGLRATATWIDAFFSNERYEAELNKTRLRLRFDAFAQEGDGVEFEVEPRLRIVLPGTGRRLSLVAQDTSNREEDADDATGDEVASDREESVEDDSSVALQLFFESTEKRSLRGQLGVRLSDDTSGRTAPSISSAVSSKAFFSGPRRAEPGSRKRPAIFTTWIFGCSSRSTQRARWSTSGSTISKPRPAIAWNKPSCESDTAAGSGGTGWSWRSRPRPHFRAGATLISRRAYFCAERSSSADEPARTTRVFASHRAAGSGFFPQR
jgi:hypothetical protein